MDSGIFGLAKLAQGDGTLSPNTRRLAAGVGSALAAFLMAKYLMKIDDVPAQLALAGTGAVLGVGADEFVRSRDAKVPPPEEEIERRREELATVVERKGRADKSSLGLDTGNLVDRSGEGVSTFEGMVTNGANIGGGVAGVAGLRDLYGVENVARAGLREAIKTAGPQSFSGNKGSTPAGMTELQNAALEVHAKAGKGATPHTSYQALLKAEPRFVVDNIPSIQRQALKTFPKARDRKLFRGSLKMALAGGLVTGGQFLSNYLAEKKVEEALDAGELVLKQQPEK